MRKEVINADEYEFSIRVMPHRQSHGLYLNHESFSCERLLAQFWSKSECRKWIFDHFIGEKGTHFNITVEESVVVQDEEGYLHLEPKREI